MGQHLFRHGLRRATFPKGEGFAALNNNLVYQATKLEQNALLPFEYERIILIFRSNIFYLFTRYSQLFAIMANHSVKKERQKCSN
jgi:hypothetical protein